MHGHGDILPEKLSCLAHRLQAPPWAGASESPKLAVMQKMRCAVGHGFIPMRQRINSNLTGSR